MKDNIQLQIDVRAELAWDPRIDDRNIVIATSNGVVTLTGSVPSYADKCAAERAAERVAGVRAVANDLAVAVPIPLQRSDTEIARACANALEWDVHVPGNEIKCAVSSGWVTLDGKVEWQFERDAAARAIRNLSGVRGVTNNIVLTAKPVSPRDVSLSIEQALERRAERTTRHIRVAARDGGVVTLTGTVASYADRRAAVGAAWSAPGVTEVRDHLQVSVYASQPVEA